LLHLAFNGRIERWPRARDTQEAALMTAACARPSRSRGLEVPRSRGPCHHRVRRPRRPRRPRLLEVGPPGLLHLPAEGSLNPRRGGAGRGGAHCRLPSLEKLRAFFLYRRPIASSGRSRDIGTWTGRWKTAGAGVTSPFPGTAALHSVGASSSSGGRRATLAPT
jgi:hypothetical protein